MSTKVKMISFKPSDFNFGSKHENKLAALQANSKLKKWIKTGKLIAISKAKFEKTTNHLAELNNLLKQYLVLEGLKIGALKDKKKKKDL